MKDAILRFSDVYITYANGYRAVRGASLTVAKGECVAVVGESGSGKTTLARAALGLLPNGASVSGSIEIEGTEIVRANEKTLRSIRGLTAGFVAQEPFASFNPLFSVYDHIAEARRVHAYKPDANDIFRSLEKLGIEDPNDNGLRYPHEWSGGMLQRASIAAASAFDPVLIVADEPTSAIDADRAEQILTALRSTGSALLLISHDIGLVRRFSDRIAVCFQGRIVESGDTGEIFSAPKHEYTKFLLSAGDSPRRGEKSGTAKTVMPDTVVEARNVRKIYGNGAAAVCAVREASIRVAGGEIVGICGTSGSGKSTLLRLLATIETPSVGEVILGNEVTTSGDSRKLLCGKAREGFVMPIFQNAVESLDRNWPIRRIVCEPLEAAHRREKLSKAEKHAIASRALGEVGLDAVDPDAKPSHLSVGQCQRVSIARALIARPRLITADEPTSALDASHSNAVMKLFAKISHEHGTAVVIVSHDEHLLNLFCDRVLRMDRGVLVG